MRLQGGVTLASAAGLTFPKEKKAPPRITIFFTLLANELSRLMAYNEKTRSSSVHKSDFKKIKGGDS